MNIPYTSDTSSEAMAVQLECLRKMSPQQRLRKMLALSTEMRRMAFDAIRRQDPALDEAGVKLRFIEVAYGSEIAEGVAKWTAERSR
jgi:hypothetical protein